MVDLVFIISLVILSALGVLEITHFDSSYRWPALILGFIIYILGKVFLA